MVAMGEPVRSDKTAFPTKLALSFNIYLKYNSKKPLISSSCQLDPKSGVILLLVMTSVGALRVITKNADETVALASEIGQRLRGGETIELLSDLGGGKTTFVRGLATGIGSQDQVSSPSFTLNNVYRSDRLTLNHFDFYRLNGAGIMAEELSEIISDREAVVVIEWADVVKSVLPGDRLTIKINSLSEAERQLVFDCPNSLTYLLEGIA